MNEISLAGYIQYLDRIIAECGPVPCLVPKSNAVTRRAVASYKLERDSLMRMAARYNITEVSWEAYSELWTTLCKRQKFGVLCESYSKPFENDKDMRLPQDGRLVPGYAKDALAQLRTLAECAMAGRDEQALATEAA